MTHEMTHYLTLAYCVMGLVAVIAYVPQMRAFWTKPEVCAATPLVTWFLWTCQTIVFFIYAVVANGDPLFMFNSGMFMLSTITCLVLIIRGRKIMAEQVVPSNVVHLKVA